MKLMIGLGIFIVGTFGGWIGSSMSNGNMFSLWSILLSTIGSLVGIWAGYKTAQYFGI